MRLVAFLLPLLFALPAQAVTLGSFTRDYTVFTDTTGADAGTYTQLRSSLLTSGEAVFTDFFDISSLAGQVIEEIVLTVTFGIQPSIYPGPSAWFMDLYGSDGSSQLDDLGLALTGDGAGSLSTATLQADASSGDAFAAALSNLRVDFGFRDESGKLQDLLRIYDVTLTVNGTATVPLPAPALLLLMALAGVGVSRRISRRQLT